jgi:hypothetical protein
VRPRRPLLHHGKHVIDPHLLLPLLFHLVSAAATAAARFLCLVAGNFDGRADAEKAGAVAVVVVKPIILGSHFFADTAKVRVVDPHVAVCRKKGTVCLSCRCCRDSPIFGRRLSLPSLFRAMMSSLKKEARFGYYSFSSSSRRCAALVYCYCCGQMRRKDSPLFVVSAATACFLGPVAEDFAGRADVEKAGAVAVVKPIIRVVFLLLFLGSHPLFVVPAATGPFTLLAGDFDGRADAEKAGAVAAVKPIILGSLLLAKLQVVDPHVGWSVDYGVVAGNDGNDDGNDGRVDVAEMFAYVRLIFHTIFVVDLDNN